MRTPAPAVCTVHLGRWGGDPLCNHCRRITGQPRKYEPRPPVRIRWRTSGVLWLVFVALFAGFWLGLNLSAIPGFPFHD